MLEEKTKKQKSKKSQYLVLIFKLLSALAVGIFISLVGQALINYSYFSFMFIFMTVFFSFWTLIKNMGFLAVVSIDLSFVLLIFIVKVYVVFSANG